MGGKLKKKYKKSNVLSHKLTNHRGEIFVLTISSFVNFSDKTSNTKILPPKPSTEHHMKTPNVNLTIATRQANSNISHEYQDINNNISYGQNKTINIIKRSIFKRGNIQHPAIVTYGQWGKKNKSNEVDRQNISCKYRQMTKHATDLEHHNSPT